MNILSKLKKKPKDVPLYLQEPYKSKSFVKGSIELLCHCPEQVEKNEWLANYTMDFFRWTMNFFDTIFEDCKCGEFEYSWTGAKKTNKVSPKEYYQFAYVHILDMVDNESIFPYKAGNLINSLSFFCWRYY